MTLCSAAGNSISVFMAEESHMESSWVCREKETGYSRQKGTIRATKKKRKMGLRWVKGNLRS